VKDAPLLGPRRFGIGPLLRQFLNLLGHFAPLPSEVLKVSYGQWVVGLRGKPVTFLCLSA